MSARTIAIGLKIPDNEAYTALTALRRLHVTVEHLERADVWIFETEDGAGGLVEAVKRNEALFNPNKHVLTELEDARPRDGEVWVEELGEDPGLRARLGGKLIAGVRSAKRYAAWRLYSEAGVPADGETVRKAAEVLLCNPAIERPII